MIKLKRLLHLLIFTIYLSLQVGCVLYIYYSKHMSCGFRNFGWYCPACGGTRMIVNLLNLNFIQAFNCNQFLFIGLPYFFIVLILEYVEYYKTGYLLNNSVKLFNVFIIGGLLFGMLRNIPGLHLIHF